MPRGAPDTNCPRLSPAGDRLPLKYRGCVRSSASIPNVVKVARNMSRPNQPISIPRGVRPGGERRRGPVLRRSLLTGGSALPREPVRFATVAFAERWVLATRTLRRLPRLDRPVHPLGRRGPGLARRRTLASAEILPPLRTRLLRLRRRVGRLIPLPPRHRGGVGRGPGGLSPDGPRTGGRVRGGALGIELFGHAVRRKLRRLLSRLGA